MRSLKIFPAIILMVIALTPAFLTQTAKADAGKAKVYILTLPNVGGSWVGSCDQVKEGSLDACMVKGKFIEENVPMAHPKQSVDYPPYYTATPKVVTAWWEYEDIITNSYYYSEVIVVNTHGEIFPVPSGYSKETWMDKISDAMLSRRVTWVHVAGYPFYYVKYENGTSETWGENGFWHFMGNINKGDVDCWLPFDAETDVTSHIRHTPVMNAHVQLGNWYYGDLDGGKIEDFEYAECGRPLKWSDFKDYLIMSLYEINDMGHF